MGEHNMKLKRMIPMAVLVFCLFFTSIHVYAESERDIQPFIKETSEEMFESLDVTILNENNDLVNSYEPSSRLKVSLKWQVPSEISTTPQKGDYYDLGLPDNLENIVISNSKTAKTLGSKVRIFVNEASSGVLEFEAQLKKNTISKERLVFDNTNSHFEPIIIERSKSNELKPFRKLANDLSLSVSRFEIYQSDETTSNLTGDDVVFFTGVSLTEGSGILENTYLEVKINKEHIIPGSFVASDIASQVSKKMQETSEFYLVTYLLMPLSAGTNIDVPVKFQTENGTTPDGFKVFAESTFKGDAESKINIRDTTEIVIETVKPTVQKHIKDDLWRSYDNVIIEGGLKSANSDSKLTDVISDLKSVQFSYSLRTGSNDTDPGSRIYDTIKFEDKIPDEAIFDPTDNPGWTFDSSTRIATYTYLSDSGIRLYNHEFFDKVVLNLKFPNATINEDITNTVTVTATPKNKADYESDVVSTDDIKFQLIASEPYLTPASFESDKSVSRDSFYDYKIDRESKFLWHLRIKNTAKKDQVGMNLENIIIKDYKLDERLKYSRVLIPSQSSFVGTLKITEISENGAESVIADNVSLSEDREFKISNRATAIVVTSNDKGFLKENSTLILKVETEMRDPSVAVVPKDKHDTVLFNSASYSANYTYGPTLSSESRSAIYFFEVNPSITLRKKLKNAKKNYFVDDMVDYALSVDIANFYDANNIAQTNQIVDILPVGLEYISGSANLSLSPKLITEIPSGSYEPEVVENYKGLGRTALIWKLNQFQYVEPGLIGQHTGVITIDYSTKITKFASKGLNKNQAYLSWQNVDALKPGERGTFDIFDLNYNGRTDDSISYAYTDFNYVPPRELTVRKEAKGSLDSTFLIPPSVGLSEVGTTIQYRFTLDNNSVSDITTLSMIDLIPNVNDYTASLDISNGMHRLPRNSTFKLELESQIVPPAGFKVYYTSDPIIDNTTSFYSNADWKESVQHFEEVTAFKVELEPGAKIPSESRVTFDVSFKIPNNLNLDQTDKVVNSFGVTMTPKLDFFESNLSTVSIMKYNVIGNVFEDFNKDGIFDSSSEQSFEGIKVQLVDELGNTVFDPQGKAYEVFTDNLGNYNMNVFTQGKYRIKVSPPEGYLLTQFNDDLEGSHIESVDMQQSDVFILNKETPTSKRNAGYYSEKGSILIHKLLKNGEGHIINSEESFEFMVMCASTADESNVLVPYNGPVEVYTEDMEFVRTDQIINGKLLIPANGKVRLINLTNLSRINVREKENTKYSVDGGNIDTIINQKEQEFKVTNTLEKKTTEFTVRKIWDGGPLSKPTIDIQLYRNGLPYGNLIQLENGILTHTWTNIPAIDDEGVPYTYTVDELSVPRGYSKSIEGSTITNTFVVKTIDYYVEKIWVNAPKVHPDINIQLYQNGKPYLDVVSLSNGEVNYTWENIPYTDSEGNIFEYTVDEIDVPQGYKKFVDGNTITNTLTDAPNPPEKETETHPKLPQTGLNDNLWLLASALILIAMGSSVFVYSKKEY